MVKRLGTLRAPSALEPRLGPLDAAAIVVSNVIGGGIFFVPQVVAGMVPHPWAVLGVWLLGGLLSFAGAMAYAELAAARPRAGAEYVYLRDAFGRLPAFLTGWTSFVAGFSGAIAASAVALAEYLGRFVPAAGDATPLRDGAAAADLARGVAEGAGGARGHRGAFLRPRPRARAGAARAEHAGRPEGQRAAALRRPGALPGARPSREPLDRRRTRDRRRRAARARAGHVHLLRLERGRLRRRRGP